MNGYQILSSAILGGQLLRWSHGYSLLSCQYGILHWFLNVKPNLNSEINPLAGDLGLSLYPKCSRLQSQDVYSYSPEHAGLCSPTSPCLWFRCEVGVHLRLTGMTDSGMDGINQQWVHVGLKGFLCQELVIKYSISLIDTGPLRWSISSWVSLGNLCLLKNSFISFNCPIYWQS